MLRNRDNPVGSEQREETRLAGEDRGQVQDQMPRRDDEPDINNRQSTIQMQKWRMSQVKLRVKME
eukprot:scaffold10893_cov1374-Chaetoceros_neogracile.AAC.1